MPKRISMYVLLLVTLGIFFNHFSFMQKENGVLWVVDGREVDAIGMANEKWIKLTRNCKRVLAVDPESQAHAAIRRAVQDYSPPSSASAHIVSLTTLDTWSLAEVKFKELLPAVVLFQQIEGVPQIVPNAIWSGDTHPWQAAPYIRQYIRSKAPGAPHELLACFEPQTQRF